jgi:hypothetical protein
MNLLQYCKTDEQRKVVQAVIDYNGFRQAGRELGKCNTSVMRMYRRIEAIAMSDGGLEFTEPPKGGETIDEILARKRNLFTRKKELHDFNNLIHVKVKDDKPIAVCMIGDPHIDDDGCDIFALERDLTTIANTKGMYAGHIGDLTNNWVGRLARLYANQTTTAEQAIQLMEWMLNLAPNLFVVNGNHDNWNQGADLISFVMRSVTGINSNHGGRIALNFPNGRQIRTHARHDFKGHSMYNPTHAHRRAQLWEGNRDHIYISGHKHYDALSMIPQPDGTCSWSAIVSGYKVIDDYADEHGFTSMKANPSLTFVMNPHAKTEAELVKPFWDVEVAGDYLKYLRK